MYSCAENEIKSVSNMTVAELKDYLKMRGVTTSEHLKLALLEIALAVEKMMMPIDPNHEYGNEVGKKQSKIYYS